ncbi:MAG: SDR family oxidoreductase [Gluconacetobacter diazotrophicus]|nr:SDR family oxidoreductase [Gluconacetobacter diazotrophicus]
MSDGRRKVGPDRFRLDGAVAFVTGSGRGIGLETALALGLAGAAVVVSDLAVEAGEAAAETLRREGIAAEAMALDVTESGAVDAAARLVVERHGRVDVLVNNAGVGILRDALSVTDADWRGVMDTNADAVFWCARAFGRHMVERRRGSIVNVGSMSGSIVNKPFHAAPYMVSKAAVHQITRALAVEWAGHGVRVNAVAPGYTVTEQSRGIREDPAIHDEMVGLTPMRRFAEPDEIASAVLFLASDAASYCTGTILAVDGGYTCW